MEQDRSIIVYRYRLSSRLRFAFSNGGRAWTPLQSGTGDALHPYQGNIPLDFPSLRSSYRRLREWKLVFVRAGLSFAGWQMYHGLHRVDAAVISTV